MKQQDKLFLLIKSLTKAEKRQFKLYASKYSKEESNYQKLFDAIDEQADYDEAAIKEEYKKEKFVKQLTVTKNYLYNLILECLRVNHNDISVETTLKDQLRDVEVLYSKALYSQCYPILTKAKALAQKNEKFTSLLEALEWEQRVKMREADTKEFESHLSQAHDEELGIMDDLRNRLEFKFLARKMLALSRRIWVANTEDDLVPFNEIMNHPLFSDPGNAKSFMSLFDFYNSYALYYRVKDESQLVYEYRKRGVDLMDSNPEYREAHPESHFVAVNNLVYACINIGRYREALELLPRMYAINAPFEDLQNLIHSSARNLELAIYFHLGEFQKGVERLEALENQFGNLDQYIVPNQRTPYYFYNSNLYFGKGDYKKALYWINKVLDYKEEGYRQDVHRFARILNLLIHFEIGNHEQLEYFVKSTYRFLYSRERLFHAETLVFEFLKKSVKVDGKALVKLFEEYKGLFEKLYENKYEKNIFNYIDLVTWLESKIMGVNYGELAQVKKKMLV
jgi:hypothetical protein